MTIPYERTRAVIQTEKFLLDLLDPKVTPRVPQKIREHARWCLRHYPTATELLITAEKCPEFWSDMEQKNDSR